VSINGPPTAVPGGERIIIHEIGHALVDFAHNGLYYCGEQQQGRVVVDDSCEAREYGDRTTVMGSGPVLAEDRIFNAFEELRLGNLDDANIAVIYEHGEHIVQLLSLDHGSSDGIRLVRVPLSRWPPGSVHGPTKGTAAYIELSPVGAEGVGLKTYIVNELVFLGGKASTNYLLSPGAPAERHYLRGGEVVTFGFEGMELSIETIDMQDRTDPTNAAADIRFILR
jgi:hypothetical protein